MIERTKKVCFQIVFIYYRIQVLNHYAFLFLFSFVMYEVCQQSSRTLVTKNLFYKIYTYYKLSPSKYSPLSLTHFSILFFHPSIQSRKASSGMHLSSASVAFWMASTSPKCVPFSTCFNLGKRKKSQGH